MDRKKTSNHHGHLNRRAFLEAAGSLAGGGLAVGATFEMMRPGSARGQQPAKETHTSSARVLDRIETRFSFQISVDVGTLDLGLTVATAALAGGVDIVEMGTPLLKTQGVANVTAPAPISASVDRRLTPGLQVSVIPPPRRPCVPQNPCRRSCHLQGP